MGVRAHPAAPGAGRRKPHRATLAEALSHTFNTHRSAGRAELHSAFVHDSGRALFEIALPWLDGSKTTTVDPRLVTVPLLFVAAGKDRLTLPMWCDARPALRPCRGLCRISRDKAMGAGTTGPGAYRRGHSGLARRQGGLNDGRRRLRRIEDAGAASGRLMALDVGTKTIGIATTDAPSAMLATPPTTLERGKLAVNLAALAELTKKHEIKALVIGLPLNMDGTEGPRCQSVRQFATNIASHGPPALAALPVVFQDERLSTAAVTRGMIEDYDMSRAKRAERVDAAAAAWILESALARLT